MTIRGQIRVSNVAEILGDDLEVGYDPEEDARIAETLDLFERWISAVFDDPTLAESLPDGANLIFLPEEDPVLAKRNLDAGLRMRKAGRLVAFVALPPPMGKVPTT